MFTLNKLRLTGHHSVQPCCATAELTPGNLVLWLPLVAVQMHNLQRCWATA